ncbi:MAG TPA: hypothetical protein VK660_07530 [Xanthomonadaceae bacterium]|jgi:hypothetical protein|nr:hypothetical protein [Xanthomonadaceae bacterium]
MNRLLLTSAAAVLLSATMISASMPARADTLLIDRAHMSESMARSMRGMGMGKVEQRLGAPTQKLEPRGGQKPQWPVIQRWQYPEYTVYFAHGHLVDIVLNHATPEEIGPAPVR